MLPLDTPEQPFRFREEFRAPEAYESLRGTNLRAGRSLYGDLEVGRGWKDQPRLDDWSPTRSGHGLNGAMATDDHRAIAAKMLGPEAFWRVR